MRNSEFGIWNGGGGRRLRSLLTGVMFVAVLCGVLRAADEPQKDPGKTPESAVRKKQKEENLKLMKERAAGSKIRLAGDEKSKADAGLITSPLFHYTDEPRRIVDATLWGWMSKGRLLAICKIENYPNGVHREGEWLYCFGSLSRGLVEAEFGDGHRWSARKPGIELRVLADAPAPAEGKAARFRQMKELAGRFGGTIVDLTGTSAQEMRLLTRPIYRYENAAAELADGAVFGLTTNGTNPDAVLVIELHQTASGAEWMYGLAGMTQEKLSLKLDGKEVWSKPPSASSGNFDTWTFFWENRK